MFFLPGASFSVCAFSASSCWVPFFGIYLTNFSEGLFGDAIFPRQHMALAHIATLDMASSYCAFHATSICVLHLLAAERGAPKT
ncbi:uncharacterized protein K441DRAFT_660022 [Cenococcum geophilum 1.58]|uniref:uncharacterized protein n=1 Tax=Cenococcum geophilum 1.58 TaxID=794803 RepID=UPI00358E50C0|nr:hypothetical protein K441DRAFT_660022 [Cenococcum geophilum 1.58]